MSRQTASHEYVVGGQESSPNSFPWIVALLDNYGFNFCGASLIRPNLAITAAHCVHNKKPEQIQAIVGYNDLDLALLFNRVSKVTAIKIHPMFVHAEWAHDIALLKLASSSPRSNLEPICLPSRGLRTFQNLIVAGWGRTSTSPLALKPHKLREVHLPQVDQSVCEAAWSENRVGSNQLCAGTAGKDSCTYDSGSPLMSTDPRTGKISLVGITSFGSKRCGDPDKPGVYTRTASYLDWIETYTSDFPCSWELKTKWVHLRRKWHKWIREMKLFHSFILRMSEEGSPSSYAPLLILLDQYFIPTLLIFAFH